jgi:hypothetical protein
MGSLSAKMRAPTQRRLAMPDAALSMIYDGPVGKTMRVVTTVYGKLAALFPGEVLDIGRLPF